MPLQLGEGNCQYTALNTAGTTTLNPGQASGPPTSFGVLYGMSVVSAGTAFACTLLDIVPAQGSAIAAQTNTLLNGTGSAGQNFPAGLAGVGVRYRGALVAICAGTPGLINALWD
jgi:hypothetical protein